jgi:hypothetical protein
MVGGRSCLSEPIERTAEIQTSCHRLDSCIAHDEEKRSYPSLREYHAQLSDYHAQLIERKRPVLVSQTGNTSLISTLIARDYLFGFSMASGGVPSPLKRHKRSLGHLTFVLWQIVCHNGHLRGWHARIGLAC